MTLFILLVIRTASSVTALKGRIAHMGENGLHYLLMVPPLPLPALASQGCDMGAVTRVYIKTVGYCNIHDGWGQDNIKIMEWWRSVFRFGA